MLGNDNTYRDPVNLDKDGSTYSPKYIKKIPHTWTILHKIPAGRPIISDCDSETYYTAEYLDFFLNPISQKYPLYVKDTYDFIHKVSN